MEQSCYKCGQIVEEGRPFCPHCAAPQIRVLLPEPVAAAAPYAEAESALPSPVSLPSSRTVPVIAVPVQWAQSAQPCAYAAAIASVAIVLKLMVPLIAAIGAGFLAVAFYRCGHPDALVNARSGARLGAICGILCSCITAILLPLRVAILHEGGAIRDTLLDLIRQSSARYSGPEFQAAFNFWRSQAGLGVLLACLAVFAAITVILLAMVGGVLGGTVLGQRRRD